MTEGLRWTDAHCHLEYRKVPADLSANPRAGDPFLLEVEHSAQAGVLRLIDVGTDEQRSRLACDHSASHANVWATVGLHPHDATEGWDWVQPLAQLAQSAQQTAATGAGSSGIDGARVVGIGECGLDYHYDHSPRELQRESFAAQIRIAHETGLALVIHTREAWPDTWAILREHGVPARTVFHCFTGGPAEAETCLALSDGVMLSFSGIVSYKSAPEVREAAVLCPMDRFTVETDSPYLAPVPHRGKQNKPAYVSLVGAAVAQAKGVEVAEVATASWDNAARLFGLP
jgi:TatD DNase family protein